MIPIPLAHVFCAVALLATVPATAVSKAADDPVRSLEARLASATGAERMALLNDLAKALGNVDPARQIAAAREALALARQLGDRQQEARALFSMGSGQLDRNEVKEAAANFEAAGALYAQLGDTAKRFDCIKNIGWAHESAGRFDEALASYEQALAFARAAGFAKGEAVALGLTGTILISKDDYPAALERFLKALSLHEARGDERQVAITESYVGTAFSALGEYGKALPHYERSLAGLRQLGDEANAAIVLSEIGLVHTHTKRLPEALAAFQEALEISTRIDDRMNVGRVLGNMAGTYVDLGDLERAGQAYDREIAIWRAVGNEAFVAASLANLAELDLKKKDCVAARRHVTESLRTAERSDSRSLQYSNLVNLAEAEECLGHYPAALAAVRRAWKIQQEIAGVETKKAYAGLEVRYEAEKKARQIERLRTDLELERLRLSEARLRNVLTLAGFALLAALFVVVFRRYLHLLAFWKKRTYVSHYRLERQIGAGGMAVVYEARDLLHGGSAAIKLIREEHASDPTQRRRFLNEGDVVDRLEHPGIVRVFERGEHGRTLYIAMELLAGRSLAELLRSGERFPLDQGLAVVRQIAAALVELHRHGIVHRDIKPENVMVVGEGRPPTVKLLDFGLAQCPTLTRLTDTGQIMGTLHHLAPEQITERSSSPASDVYALGSVFYELLTSEKPFLGENPGAVVRAILEQQPIPPGSLRSAVPPELSALVLRMLDKTPARRPSSEAVVAAIETLETAA